MKRHQYKCPGLAAALLLLTLFGCKTMTAKDVLSLSPESLQDRQLQSRSYDFDDEKEVLSAGAAVLQDLGFNLDESEVRLGLLVASKDRYSPTDAGRITATAILMLFSGIYVPTDHHQKMRASVVTAPLNGDRKGIAVRVTFQRIVWDARDLVIKREELKSPEIYQEFFSRLSKSLFLEANKI